MAATSSTGDRGKEFIRGLHPGLLPCILLMSQIDDLLAANGRFAATFRPITERRPRRHLAVLTCLDARINVLEAYGLELGDAAILRNAGGRVTDDVLRSLAISGHVLEVDTVVVLQHTNCGLSGVSQEGLEELTGATLPFLPISDHTATLRADVALLASTPYLLPITTIVGMLFDVDSGVIEEVACWKRTA